MARLYNIAADPSEWLLFGDDAPLGAVAPPLQGRALQRPRWSRRSEENRAGRVPEPGVEDGEDREATRVHPGGVVIEPRWVGLLVVLPEE